MFFTKQTGFGNQIKILLSSIIGCCRLFFLAYLPRANPSDIVCNTPEPRGPFSIYIIIVDKTHQYVSQSFTTHIVKCDRFRLTSPRRRLPPTPWPALLTLLMASRRVLSRGDIWSAGYLHAERLCSVSLPIPHCCWPIKVFYYSYRKIFIYKFLCMYVTYIIEVYKCLWWMRWKAVNINFSKKIIMYF